MTSVTKLPVTGGCLCGAVRYTIQAPPMATRVCWCRLCQFLGAGSGSVNVCFPTAQTRVAGPLTDFVSDADSGNRMHRRFCATCGTPEMTIWAAQAPVWACFDPALPRLEGQPPPAG